MSATVRIGHYRLPSAQLGTDNPLPFFRENAHDSTIPNDGTLTDDELQHLGWETAFRVLPYTMQDNYQRKLNPHTFTSVEMESNRYKAVLLPELGARLVSFVDKADGRELLFRNPNFQPANLSIRNAWFSGGIEWNIGQLGHTFSTCSPVFAARIQDTEGNEGVRFFDYERCKGLFWQLDLYLLDIPAGLTAHVKIVNPNHETVPMYWWTNIALQEKAGCRVISPADRGIFMLPKVGGFGAFELPDLPSIKYRDGTYSLNHPGSNEFFFQCHQDRLPWEVLAEPDGKMFLEYSTQELKARKLFCWGTGQGSRHWQEYLNDTGNSYIEIQAGLTPVQSCSIPMQGNSVWHWTQVFGTLDGDPEKLHSHDWRSVYGEVQQRLESIQGYRELDAINIRLIAAADLMPLELLFQASGWGRLEYERMDAAGENRKKLQSMPFPEESMGPAQEPWLGLLREGSFTCNPGQQYIWMVQSQWLNLLSSIPEKELDWVGNLHLGVMHHESGNRERAEYFWKQSLEKKSNAMSWRCLAASAAADRRVDDAISFMQRALDAAAANDDSGPLESGSELSSNNSLVQALGVEFLQMLREYGQWKLLVKVYESLESEVRKHEMIQICYAAALVKLDQLDGLEKLLLHDYAMIREGEISLSDIWQELWARRIAHERGEELEERHFLEAMDRYPPPYLIDFRMIQ